MSDKQTNINKKYSTKWYPNIGCLILKTNFLKIDYKDFA